MFNTLKELLDSLTASLASATVVQPAAEQEHTLQLATAVLLVEVMRADPTLDETKRDAVLLALCGKFALASDELERLLELAHETARTAYDYQRFTSLLNERFTQAQKVRVVEAMWQVAYADEHIHPNEHHVISKVAGLLHVTHGEYIGAKLRAQEAAQTQG
ncbi:MAG: TerB family tellurite resistance protein [Hydrogenophaga sp.]|uniref:tellurite resistance TerB family protein n=1 Tax=Hydrogenophaga sp. TaxID=1904254 RepID=UPI001BBBFF2D|nr:TerB family tellurite resistance protein [Hydrogenophaga sp.]MBS3912070.1 TerB family tellurite resistance protein [Hydrogenophaga sp.]MDO9147639.1 TerB family tellurite resistance protein [Hydrogenophaga sp.]MDO9606388.1 TerB family tellurite resistance protein [Hydrogenophaga sp.]